MVAGRLPRACDPAAAAGWGGRDGVETERRLREECRRWAGPAGPGARGVDWVGIGVRVE